MKHTICGRGVSNPRRRAYSPESAAYCPHCARDVGPSELREPTREERIEDATKACDSSERCTANCSLKDLSRHCSSNRCARCQLFKTCKTYEKEKCQVGSQELTQ